MSRTTVALIVAFVFIFAAGAVVGRVVWGTTTSEGDHVAAPQQDPSPAEPPKHGKGDGPGRERSFWVEALGLTTQQAEDMQKIWGETMRAAGEQFHEGRQRIDKEFDDKLRAQIGDANFTAYTALREERQRQMEELGKGRVKAIEEAIRRTKAEVLTPEQATKYDEIMAKRKELGGDRDGRGPRDRDGRRGGPGGPGGGPPGFGAPGMDRDRSPRGAGDRPSTRPATQPAGA